VAKVKRKPFDKITGRFIPIMCEMLESAAYKALTPRQQILYIYCRNEEFHPKRFKPDKSDPKQFYFNEAIWSDKIDPETKRQGYGLYSLNHPAHFYRDMDALIMYGFIKCIYPGATQKQRNIYKYSDKWKQYGTREFEILPSEMTKSLLNKREKQQEAKKAADLSALEEIFGTGDETAERKDRLRKQLENL